jgi:homoserine acetyltransferase
MVRLTETRLAGNRAERRVIALVPHPHLVVDRHLPLKKVALHAINDEVGVNRRDANDALWAIEAIQDYNPEPDLDKINAKVLLINDAEDHANPPELGTVERAMKRVKHGRYVLIPAGPDTHGHFSHFYAELWKPYLIEFMKTLDPPLAAAAE